MENTRLKVVSKMFAVRHRDGEQVKAKSVKFTVSFAGIGVFVRLYPIAWHSVSFEVNRCDCSWSWWYDGLDICDFMGVRLIFLGT